MRLLETIYAVIAYPISLSKTFGYWSCIFLLVWYFLENVPERLFNRYMGRPTEGRRPFTTRDLTDDLSRRLWSSLHDVFLGFSFFSLASAWLVSWWGYPVDRLGARGCADIIVVCDGGAVVLVGMEISTVEV